ncbi:hypothetical protein C8R43DRAFT_1110652 [Mycena crocata]|nr:hypothetical protein C8R43DRAFT_1110652 [Mycena crocata]
MYSKTIVASLALLAVTSPAFSVPVPNVHGELEARLSLPAGAVKDLLKSLGSGVLSGGAISGLLALLGAGGDAPAARDLDNLEARGALSSLLQKLIGVGEEGLESVLKKAVIGGAASGVAIEGVNTVAGQRRGVPVGVASDAVKVAEKGIGSVISNGVVGGIGSALGGLGIGAILEKLFGTNAKRSLAELSDEDLVKILEYIGEQSNAKRSLADLSDDEVVALLEYIGEHGVDKRAVQLGSIGKGIAGLVASLAATQGAEAAIEQLKDLFARELSAGSLNDLD